MYAINSVEPQSQADQTLWDLHRQLAIFNKTRIIPQTPQQNWRKKIHEDLALLTLEGEVLEQERHEIAQLALGAPQKTTEFMQWFAELRNVGPGQNDPLFVWLAEEATREQMTWFIKQEVAGEAGFEDLTALTQIKMPTQAKLEMARNYWDEMGRGQERGMHGPMLTRLAQELQIPPSPLEEIVPESLALANILLGLALNRRYAYHSIGALGIIEMTAPDRALHVYQGLKRLGLSGEAQRYYLLHSTLDKKHSEDWNAQVIQPLISERPELSPFIAEGALLRLNAGARCFARYRKELWTH